MNSAILKFIKSKYPNIIFLLITAIIVLINLRPGFLILGNDNFSPEIDPKLTLTRSLFSPAWRTHRALGIPSDSEQADIFRTTLFNIFNFFKTPNWAISQFYIFFTLYVAMWSFSKLAQKVLKQEENKILQTFAGIFYISSLLGIWIYFSPVHLFLAAYAFSPLVLLSVKSYVQKPSPGSMFLIILSSFFFATTGLTATMFITAFGTIVLFSSTFFITNKGKIKHTLIGLSVVFITNLFWILPFGTYVISNTKDLENSLIYRKITPATIQNEVKYNTALNTLTYKYSWIHTQEEGGLYAFSFRNWYAQNPLSYIFILFPLLLAGASLYFIVKNKRNDLIALPIITFIGWFFIKGGNPPLGFVFSFLQKTFPTYFGQVFRWQSSKFWPLLGLTIPILSSFGFIEIYKKINKKNIYLIISGILLITNMFPLFAGSFIRDKAYVKIPDDYYSLAQYLKEEDPNGRIYASPEANTLYFRNYDWGFWGSVMLNYLLPNPVVEKALVIGSQEAENGFRLLSNAYHSENPDVFVNALKLYDIKYVLSDKHAGSGYIGYHYDWENHAKVIENNPQLEKMWEQNKLSLFKVKENTEEVKTVKIFAPNSYTTNAIISKTKYVPYYVNTKDPNNSLIYPFGLKFNSVERIGDSLNGRTIYNGRTDNYHINVTRNLLEQLPIKLDIGNNNEFTFKSALPIFNEIIFEDQLQVPTIKYQGPGISIPYITFNNLVFENKPYEQAYLNLSLIDSLRRSRLNLWKEDNTKLNILDSDAPNTLWCNDKKQTRRILINENKTPCGTGWIDIQNNSVLDFEISILAQNANPVRATFCAFSENLQRCVNTEKNFFIKGQTKRKVYLPQIVNFGDRIQLFLDFRSKDKENIIDINQLDMRIFESYVQPTMVEDYNQSSIPPEQKASFNLTEGQEITLTIPIMSSEGTFVLDKYELPDINVVPYNDNSQITDSEIMTNWDRLITKHKESNASIYTTIPNVDQEGLGMMYIEGQNLEGIPSEVRMRAKSKGNYIWENKFFMNQRTQLLEYIFIPTTMSEYVLEIDSRAFGPNYSTNAVDEIIFQMLPDSWLNIYFEPTGNYQGVVNNAFHLNPLKKDYATNIFTGTTSNELVALPTATSNNWILKEVNNVPNNLVSAYYQAVTPDFKLQKQKAIINGWQQAWLVNNSENNNYVSYYWPNFLVYLGYSINIIMFLVLGILSIKNILKKGAKERLSRETGNYTLN